MSDTGKHTDPLILDPVVDWSIKNEQGSCKDVSDCTTQGYNEANHCPGPSNVQCCVTKQCGSGGTCLNRVGDGGGCSSGHWEDNRCPGDESIKVRISTSRPFLWLTLKSSAVYLVPSPPNPPTLSLLKTTATATRQTRSSMPRNRKRAFHTFGAEEAAVAKQKAALIALV